MWLTKIVRALDHDLDHDLDRGLKRLRAKTLGKRTKKGATRKSTEDFRIFRARALTPATPIQSEWTPAESPDDETA